MLLSGSSSIVSIKQYTENCYYHVRTRHPLQQGERIAQVTWLYSMYLQDKHATSHLSEFGCRASAIASLGIDCRLLECVLAEWCSMSKRQLMKMAVRALIFSKFMYLSLFFSSLLLPDETSSLQHVNNVLLRFKKCHRNHLML